MPRVPFILDTLQPRLRFFFLHCDNLCSCVSSILIDHAGMIPLLVRVPVCKNYVKTDTKILFPILLFFCHLLNHSCIWWYFDWHTLIINCNHSYCIVLVPRLSSIDSQSSSHRCFFFLCCNFFLDSFCLLSLNLFAPPPCFAFHDDFSSFTA